MPVFNNAKEIPHRIISVTALCGRKIEASRDTSDGLSHPPIFDRLYEHETECLDCQRYAELQRSTDGLEALLCSWLEA